MRTHAVTRKKRDKNAAKLYHTGENAPTRALFVHDYEHVHEHGVVR